MFDLGLFLDFNFSCRSLRELNNKPCKSTSNSAIAIPKPAPTTTWERSPRNCASLSKPARTTNKLSKSKSNSAIATPKPSPTTSWAGSRRHYASLSKPETSPIILSLNDCAPVAATGADTADKTLIVGDVLQLDAIALWHSL
jgi:hypothetical protein